MRTSPPVDKLLRSSTPRGVPVQEIAVLVEQCPFSSLKELLSNGVLSLPRVYANATKKLGELERTGDTGATYKVREQREVKELSYPDYKAYTEDVLEPYSREPFYKRRLTADIELLMAMIESNRDVIASHKTMDDHWVKEALRELRAKDRKQRTELKEIIATLTACALEKPKANGEQENANTG